jgi:hypothetical protein
MAKRIKRTPVALTDAQLKYQNHIPEDYRANYEKAMQGVSKSAALKAKCLDCTCWQRAEIRECPISWCPLFPYHPFKSKAGA